MLLKSRTSTLHTFMKLLVVVWILICTNVVVATLTSEPVEHRRLGGILSILGRWFGKISFEDKWENAFRHQALEHFANEKDTVSDEAWEQAKTLSSDEAFSYLKLHESTTDLLRGETYKSWVNRFHSRVSIENLAKETLKLLRKHEISDTDLVKMINAGIMDPSLEIRVLANQMELQLLETWKSVGKSRNDLLKDLELNKMKAEMELYANPAFTTWMKFAFHLSEGEESISLVGADDAVFRSMRAVLQDEMKNSIGFKELLKVRANTKNEKKLFKKWGYIYKTQSSWHEIVHRDQ